jgi:hypothetical protein
LLKGVIRRRRHRLTRFLDCCRLSVGRNCQLTPNRSCSQKENWFILQVLPKILQRVRAIERNVQFAFPSHPRPCKGTLSSLRRSSEACREDRIQMGTRTKVIKDAMCFKSAAASGNRKRGQREEMRRCCGAAMDSGWGVNLGHLGNSLGPPRPELKSFSVSYGIALPK